MPNILCENCLDDGAVGVPLGDELGHQRDPYQDHVSLCPPCKVALLAHDFRMLSHRYRQERTITNGPKQ